MRRSIDDLESPNPLMSGMPSVFHGDDFTVRFLAAFDDVLAPIHSVVSDMDSYFDPEICPSDFLDWIGSWVGVPINHRWPLQRRRSMLRSAVAVHRLRGTLDGIANAVELYAGVTPEVIDSGGCVASGEPGSNFPGNPRPSVHIKITKSADVDAEVIDQIVEAAKPAHVMHTIEIIEPR